MSVEKIDEQTEADSGDYSRTDDDPYYFIEVFALSDGGHRRIRQIDIFKIDLVKVSEVAGHVRGTGVTLVLLPAHGAANNSPDAFIQPMLDAW